MVALHERTYPWRRMIMCVLIRYVYNVCYIIILCCTRTIKIHCPHYDHRNEHSRHVDTSLSPADCPRARAQGEPFPSVMTYDAVIFRRGKTQWRNRDHWKRAGGGGGAQRNTSKTKSILQQFTFRFGVTTRNEYWAYCGTANNVLFFAHAN